MVAKPKRQPTGGPSPALADLSVEDGGPSDRASQQPELSEEEGQALFDAAAWSLAGMSGQEWLRRYRAGEFDPLFDHPDHPEVVDLYMLLPFARQDA